MARFYTGWDGREYESGDWDDIPPCPNCGDTSRYECANCWAYGAHNGPCHHHPAADGMRLSCCDNYARYRAKQQEEWLARQR